MAIKASTGLRNKLLDTSPLKTIFNLGFLNVYSGTIPTDADQSISGATLLCAYSNNNTATGITFASTASGGAITKNLAETWSRAAAGSGTATFYRLVAAGDTGALSTTEARIQGSVGLAGADLNFASLSFTATTVYTVDTYTVSLPAF
jgi:hypothetical protein